ncbi:MAG TPA: hydrogenase accessory protein HypB [Deltaproteobacteria bacterium]|nr:hydrogenase accessory protein HypB [Deltaproteobacteria bacterium]
MHEIAVNEKILAANDAIAAANRRFFESRRIFAVNVISSPGSGKTSLIEAAARRLGPRLPMAVVEGDMTTELDAERIGRCGVAARQITTGRACHLDAHMISHVLDWVGSLEGLRLLIIENVGNMVCPAGYDLGEAAKIAVMSVAEGDDKPLKYPALFAASPVLVINKTDLLGHTDFDMDRAEENARAVNPEIRILRTSCRTGEGLERWCAFLEGNALAPEDSSTR